MNEFLIGRSTGHGHGTEDRAHPKPAPQTQPAPPLPLENGDRLARPEFERRYHAMPHVNKAELIEGIVYMPSPVSHEQHGRPHFLAKAG